MLKVEEYLLVTERLGLSKMTVGYSTVMKKFVVDSVTLSCSNLSFTLWLSFSSTVFTFVQPIKTAPTSFVSLLTHLCLLELVF